MKIKTQKFPLNQSVVPAATCVILLTWSVVKSGEIPSDHSWSDGLAWSPASANLDFILYLTHLSDRIAWHTNICQPSLHSLSDTPGQIENIGALSTTGITLLTSGLVDWPQRRYQVLLLQDWAVLQLHGRHLAHDQPGNHQVLGKCSLVQSRVASSWDSPDFLSK